MFGDDVKCIRSITVAQVISVIHQKLDAGRTP